VVIALEPSEPSRAVSRRLLDAVSLRASIRHPNLARAWPLGWADGRLFVDLELPSYPTLAERLAAAPLEPVECVRILDGVAAGAAALLERGLAARDVTPEDVVVHPADGGILMDLGIPAELVRSVAGEPGGGPIDARSLVHSLGGILVTALTGAPRDERHGDLAPEVDRVLARAMAADPAERYPDVTALSQAAAAALGVRAAPASAPSNGNGVRRPPRRNRRHADSTHGIQAPSPPKTRPRVRRHPDAPAAESRPRRRTSFVRGAGPRHARRALAAAARRCAELVVALIAVAVAASERLQDHISRFAAWVAPTARTIGSGMGRAPRRSAEVIRPTVASTRRVLGEAARRGAERARGLATAGRDASRRVHAKRERRRILSFAGRGVNWWHGLDWPEGRAMSSLRRGAPVLLAGSAIVASVLAGAAIGASMDAEEGPLSVARSGLTVQLPPGWKETTAGAGWSAISPALAAGPSDDSRAALVVAKLSSLAVAERILDDLRGGGQARTPVRLGNSYAWRYAVLRPRPDLVGTGYAVPTARGAVVFTCRAPRIEARERLAQCDRAATTLVIQGEGSRPLSALSRSKERLIRVIATLRSSRSEGRRRLAAADQPEGQVRAAATLQRDYTRAAQALEGLPPLENGRPLDGVSAAVRDAAAAYANLADAAQSGSRSAYREAGDELILREQEVRRELARASGA
jgi:hypothetical protein